MTHSTEWANVQGGEQMELATVVNHSQQRTAKVVGCQFGEKAVIAEIPYYESHLCEATKIYEPTTSPDHAGARLAKLLHQYDGSPSSELWRTIQALSYEILRDSK